MRKQGVRQLFAVHHNLRNFESLGNIGMNAVQANFNLVLLLLMHVHTYVIMYEYMYAHIMWSSINLWMHLCFFMYIS